MSPVQSFSLSGQPAAGKASQARAWLPLPRKRRERLMQVDVFVASGGPGALGILLVLMAVATLPWRRARSTLPIRRHRADEGSAPKRWGL